MSVNVMQQEMDASKIPNFESKDLLDAYFDAHKEAVDFVQKEIVPVLNGQIGLKPHEEAVIGTFFRMHALASSLTRLNNKVDFNAIAVIARTIFEVLIDLKLLYKPSEEDLAKFRTFPKVDRFRKAHKILDFQKANPGVDADSLFDAQMRKEFVEQPGKKDEIEKEVRALWGQNSKGEPIWPDHWTHTNIRDRAKSFGPTYEQEYLEIYSFLSWYAHAGTAGYAGFNEKSLESIYGISLNLARKMYIEGIIICSKVFPLPAAMDSFHQIVDFLKNAPEQFLVDLGLQRAANAA